LKKAENAVIARKNTVEADAFNETYSKIKSSHKELVEYLQNIQKEYGNIFGIPEDISLDTADGGYFVALPARGINLASDENAGRDYLTPKESSVSLPPLREIFYFSALDYDDISKDKKGRPVISELLVEKYNGESWNYLPEIWLNILARPNLREDKLYQNTFVEKSMNEEQLKAMLNKSNSDTEYKKMIWRSGVFPCRYSGKIVDVDGPSDISNTKKQSKRKRTLRQLSSSISDAKFTCQEIINSSETVGSSENYTGLYPEISELGNFLAMSGSRLIYRNELKNIYNYLTTENKKIDKSKDPETSIHRVAERTTFIRNVFGGFLDAVEMENTTYNTLQNYEEDVNESLQSLCEQLQNVNVVDADEKCENWKLEEKILATAVDDNQYDVDCKNAQTLSGSGYIYKAIFCTLDNKKAELLNQIENGWSDDGTNKGYNSLKNKMNDSRYTERLTEIKNALNILKEDSSEWCLLTPSNKDAGSVDTANCKADRDTLLEGEEEAIAGMGNYDLMAYCPIY
jgi:hypothetical protein